MTSPEPTLVFPPFPKMTWDKFLEQWKFEEDFSSGVHRGSVEVFLKMNGPIPTDAQISAYEYLNANEAAVAEAVLTALYKEYRLNYPNSYWDMPKITKKAQLLELELLSEPQIVILPEEERGTAYIFYDFDSWDEEHGHGVKLHKRRVLKVGGVADVL